MKPILKVSIGSLRFVLPNYENEDEYISLGVGAIDVSTKGDKESLTYLLNVETLNIIAMRDHREKHILNDISFQCVAELFRDDLNMDASIQRIHFHLDLVSIEFILLIARALVADLPKSMPHSNIGQFFIFSKF